MNVYTTSREIIKTPNDADLGALIRDRYNRKKLRASRRIKTSFKASRKNAT